jgi:hypothetical protein
MKPEILLTFLRIAATFPKVCSADSVPAFKNLPHVHSIYYSVHQVVSSFPIAKQNVRFSNFLHACHRTHPSHR